MVDETEQQVKESEFAFIVVKQKDGRYAIANVNNENTERPPTLEDISIALRTLTVDLDRQATAMAVVATLQQVQGAGSPQQGSSGLIVPERKFVKRTK